MSSASDPKAPVTGYPAPPPPHGTAYPYPYPAPPQHAAAAAYAYPAPPPHTAPYYAGAQTAPPAAYGYARPSRNTTLIRRLIAVAIGVFVVMGAATLILWLVLRPRVPEFSVTSASVSGFNVSVDAQQLSAQFDLTFSVLNRNEKMSVRYEHMVAGVLYNMDSIADTSLPPFEQAKGETTPVRARLVAASEYVGDGDAKRIAADRADEGTVSFEVRVSGWAVFRSGAWRTRRHLIRVSCEGIDIGFKNSTVGVGSLAGSPKKCRVYV